MTSQDKAVITKKNFMAETPIALRWNCASRTEKNPFTDVSINFVTLIVTCCTCLKEVTCLINNINANGKGSLVSSTFYTKLKKTYIVFKVYACTRLVRGELASLIKKSGPFQVFII